LRGAKEVIGYTVEGQDGELGQVADFILDDANWTIRYMVLDTGSILKGKKVLIAPQWIDEIEYKAARISVHLGRENIAESPAYDPEMPINRRQEEVLYDFHGRPYYWTERA
jgi:hypothetical protein